MIFFCLLLNKSNENVLESVSTVFPDLDIIINRVLDSFSFFYKT